MTAAIVGSARAETMDEVLKCVAMDYDFVIVPPEKFESLLLNGEPRLPMYVDGAAAADLETVAGQGGSRRETVDLKNGEASNALHADPAYCVSQRRLRAPLVLAER